MQRKRWLPLLLFFSLVIFLYLGLSLDSKKIPSPLIGKPFPSMSMNSLGEVKPVHLLIQPGSVSLVNVFASWCVTCLAEHDALIALSKNQNIKLIGVNYKDKLEDAQNFLKKYGNPYDEILFDNLGKLGLELGVYATPETFIIDKDGIIRYKHIGEITDKIITSEINPLLNRLL